MNYIRQEMLFSFEDMLDFNVKKRYETLLGNFNLSILHSVIGNQSHLGAPSQLNQYAMFISLIGRVVKRIPIKDLVRRLKQDPHFRWECGFIFSDRTPSEASYSRFIKLLADTNIIDELNAKVIETAIVEGFMDGETISIDSTHIEARDAYQANQDQIIDTEPTLPPKKRGRKKKCEREAWVLKKQQEEENLPIYKKTIEKQLDIPLETLVSEMPMAPKWGVKKNSKGKNVFWYGYKGHLAVDSQSQYIVKGFLTSGNINDGKLAIPLMKSTLKKYHF